MTETLLLSPMISNKPTRNPVHNNYISFHVGAYGPCDFEKELCSINDTAAEIQRFALMFLPVRAKVLGEVIGIPVGIGKLYMKFLDGLLKIC